jgi:CubicO group peptidase (beta-lactamase class C family)
MRHLAAILSIASVTLCSCSKHTPSYTNVPGISWEQTTPSEAGITPAAVSNFINKVEGQGCIVRYGKMVAKWGYYDHAFDIASAVKPIYAHLTYMSIVENMIPDLDSHVSDFEPRLKDLNANLDHKDADITWRHLVTQTSGYGIQDKPGSAFNYNDFPAALLIDTLTMKVWKTTFEEADQTMLHPLLSSYVHFQDAPTLNGRNAHPGRIRISPRDFARFGLLYMREGRWGPTQVLDSDMAIMATTSPLPSSLQPTKGEPAQMLEGQRSIGNPHGHNWEDHSNSYSYFWWINGVRDDGTRFLPDAPADTFLAAGHGGQNMLIMIPSLDLVVSVLEGLGGERPGLVSGEGRVLINDHLKILLEGISPDSGRKVNH